MTRQMLGNGKWFDLDAALKWDEATSFDGRNHVSQATGSNFEHERLYRTRQGRYVLHWWSDWQGPLPRWTLISENEAFIWLINQGYHDEVPMKAIEDSEI